MTDEAIPAWIRIEERGDGPPGCEYAIVIRGEVTTWCSTRESAEVMQRALAQAWMTELNLEVNHLVKETDSAPTEP